MWNPGSAPVLLPRGSVLLSLRMIFVTNGVPYGREVVAARAELLFCTSSTSSLQKLPYYERKVSLPIPGPEEANLRIIYK